VSIGLRRAAVAAAFTVAAGGLAACGGDEGGGEAAGGGGGEGGTIALLLPESKTARYESHDRPLFEAKIKELCADCRIIYSNADQDAAKQQQQVESALTEGAQVLVFDPVDGKAAASVASSAKGEGVPVVAYDRFIAGVDYYVSYQNEKVGQIQGQSLVNKLKADGATGGLLMVNGSPTDANAGQFKKGAHSVIDGSGFTVLAEYDTPDWSPDKAQEWVSGQLNQYQGQLAGVYAANDGTAGGAIAAMKAAGVNPMPPVTGQDAELAAIQRIVAGDQYMTVYKAIKPEADLAAEAAIALLNGEKPKSDTEFEGVASTLLEPVAVIRDNIKDTVIKDDYWKASDICTGEYAQACATLGLT
jgi:D-xylose transport system substrate-binding protein